jgi:hypothetical protein
MALYFDCKTNADRSYVNYAVFTDGEKNYKVDRVCSYGRGTVDNYLSMEWTYLYIWDSETETETPIDDSWFKDKKFVGFEIDDDANTETGAKYYCTPIKVMYGDELTEIKHTK